MGKMKFLKQLILIPLIMGAVVFLAASFFWPLWPVGILISSPETAEFIRLQAIHFALLSIGCSLLAILVKSWLDCRRG